MLKREGRKSINHDQVFIENASILAAKWLPTQDWQWRFEALDSCGHPSGQPWIPPKTRGILQTPALAHKTSLPGTTGLGFVCSSVLMMTGMTATEDPPRLRRLKNHNRTSIFWDDVIVSG